MTPPSEALIEAVARDEQTVEFLAQVIYINLAGGSQWSDVVEHFKDKYRDTARAAMKAHVDQLADAGLVVERDWMPIETAPKDGSKFLAQCIRREPFSPGPTYFLDFARWDGKDTRDPIGRFASRVGDIVVMWRPMIAPPVIAALRQPAEGGVG